MRVRMIKDERGSPNGIDILDYKKDTEYDLPDDLAKAFLNMGSAIKASPKIESKAFSAAPENASVSSPEIKSEVKDNRGRKSKRRF